jgi:hypothetical protein
MGAVFRGEQVAATANRYSPWKRRHRDRLRLGPDGRLTGMSGNQRKLLICSPHQRTTSGVYRSGRRHGGRYKNRFRSLGTQEVVQQIDFSVGSICSTEVGIGRLLATSDRAIARSSTTTPNTAAKTEPCRMWQARGLLAQHPAPLRKCVENDGLAIYGKLEIRR